MLWPEVIIKSSIKGIRGNLLTQGIANPLAKLTCLNESHSIPQFMVSMFVFIKYWISKDIIAITYAGVNIIDLRASSA